VTDYLDWFRAIGRKSIKETTASIHAFILPQLGDNDVLSLTPARLRKWHAEIAAQHPRDCARSPATHRRCAIPTATPKLRAVAAPPHADTRMVEKHYGHLATSYMREAIRAAKPLGIGNAAKVIPMAGSR
jgi:hypothetical protein